MENTFNLLGEIVADDSARWYESDITPAIVIGWLNKQQGDVTININSPGGDVTAGLAIANAIRAYDKGRVTARVLGIAASMASCIACACDELQFGKGAFLMIHNPWGGVVGDSEELRKQADVMDKMRDSIIAFYLSKFEKTSDELIDLMSAETWIAAEEIESYNLQATLIAPEEEEQKIAACLSHRAFASAPAAAVRFFEHREKPLANSEVQPTQSAEVQPTQSAEVQPTSQDEVQPTPANEVQPTSQDEVQPTSQDEVQPTPEPAPAEPAAKTAPAENWEARYKGLMKKFNQQNEAHSAIVKDLNRKLEESRKEFDEVNASLNALRDESKKLSATLVQKDEQIAELNRAHAVLTGGVLSPASSAVVDWDARIASAKTPEQREAIRNEKRLAQNKLH